MQDGRLKILWVKSGPLHPLDTGGKLRTYNMLKELSKNHQVTFLTLESRTAAPDWKLGTAEYCQDVISIPWKESRKLSLGFYLELLRNSVFSSRPYAIDKYVSHGMKDKIRELDKGRFDLIVCDFLAPAVNFPEHFSTPTLLFQHNVESEIWRRHYEEAKGSLVTRKYFHSQWKRMQDFEKKCCARFDGVVTVSARDSETLKHEMNVNNILGDVPAGVDSNYFQPADRDQKRPNRIVFTGSMDWMPNDDAVKFFIKEIYPGIKSSVPDVTFTIAGRNPSGALMEMAKTDTSIQVTGTVEDIRPYVTESAIMVVPLRIGGGTRIKIFEGMAMGVPIVSTSIGAEGLPVIHGDNIMLADDADSFSREVISLLTNSHIRIKIADTGLAMVRKSYSWEAVSRIFESHCRSLLKDVRGLID